MWWPCVVDQSFLAMLEEFLLNNLDFINDIVMTSQGTPHPSQKVESSDLSLRHEIVSNSLQNAQYYYLTGGGG